MPRLAHRTICSGCMACQTVCPKGAIILLADDDGFFYPQVDGFKCVQCGRCEKVCPSLNQDLPRKPVMVYAAKAKDDDLRMKSSSGGVFSLLSRQVIARGGIVYGAGFDHQDWHVVHKSAESEDELEDLRGSKYVQSDVRGVYAAVEINLKKGREVLFSGTPCQVSGLRHCLATKNVGMDKLLLVDVICHAAPSPWAWRKYLDERLAKAGPGAIIRRIAFRHKNCGWKRYSLSLRFANDKEYRCDLHADSFLRGFLSELFNRPSCHHCQCRELRSGSDLTIADYWSVHEKFPDMDDDRGTSLVLVNTNRGASVFDEIAPYIVYRESDFADAVRVNPALVRSPVLNPHRNKFFRRVRRGRFDSVVSALLTRPLWWRIASRIKRAMQG